MTINQSTGQPFIYAKLDKVNPEGGAHPQAWLSPPLRFTDGSAQLSFKFVFCYYFI